MTEKEKEIIRKHEADRKKRQRDKTRKNKFTPRKYKGETTQ
jgi:hypothetical protein